jgi:hypothetical protein
VGAYVPAEGAGVSRRTDHTSASEERVAIEKFLDRLPDWSVALFTFVLAIFTGLLWRSTEKLWKAGERQIAAAQDAAHAALLTARAGIALQLPIIRIKPESLGHGDVSDGTTVSEHCSVHCVTFSNLGPTRAFPIELLCGWTIGKELPDEASYPIIESLTPNLILEPDPKATLRLTLSFDMPLNSGEWSLICSGKLDVWFYCVLVYDDFMQTRHQVGYCWRWQNVGGGMDWRPNNTPAYNRKT